jgi:hypothetical protein
MTEQRPGRSIGSKKVGARERERRRGSGQSGVW